MATYCEDYPCCGHTDGLGCNWTYTPETRAYDIQHAMCDHAVGFCDAALYDTSECIECGESHEKGKCPECGACDFQGSCWNCWHDVMEDQWLDGSYEE